MVDPITAIGVASSIIQLVDFSSKLIAGSKEIYQSASGALSEHIELEIVAADLKSLTQKASFRITAHSRGACAPISSEDEARLQQLAISCHEISDEILTILQDVRTKGPHLKWQSFRQAVRGVWYKDKIEDLEKRLQRIRGEIMFHLVAIMSTVTDKQTTIMSEILACLKKGTEIKNEPTDISADLRTFMEEAKRVQRTSKILNSLYFYELHDREVGMRSAHANTYDWIFESHEGRSYEDVKYMDWLKTGRDTYWISGKAGSGKSTLMKLLYNHECTKNALNTWAEGNCLVIASHFFWSGGTEMQMSPLGLFRSLLYQVLGQQPDMIPHVCPKRWQTDDRVCTLPWTVEELHTAFLQLALQDLQSLQVCLFIDGPDECHGEHRELVNMLTQLSKSRTIKMCVSSRSWNVFESAFGNEDAQVLVLQKYTRPDIARYVKDKLEQDRGFSKLMESNVHYQELVTEITLKAEGVFLWVFFVVRSLLCGVDDENDIFTMRNRVHDLPSDLEDYFQLILDHLDPFYQTQSAHIFLLMTTARHHPCLFAFGFLEKATNDSQYPIREDFISISDAEVVILLSRLEKYVNARCKDLLEIKRRAYGYPTHRLLNDWVEFPHRTVRDFLRKKQIQDLFRSRANDDFDTLTVLCRLQLAQVKALVSQNNSHYKYSEALETFSRDMLWISYHLEVSQRRSEIALLDELDRIHRTEVIDRDVAVHKSFWFREDDFLLAVMKMRLTIYVTHKLNQKLTLDLRNSCPKPALAHLLHETGAETKYSCGEGLPLLKTWYDIDMISLLLQHKADPNQEVHIGHTVWSEFLGECWESRTRSPGSNILAIEGLYYVAELLIRYGADLDRECEVPVLRPYEPQLDRNACKPRLLSPSEILRQSLLEPDWVRLEMAIAEKRKSARSSFWDWIGWW